MLERLLILLLVVALLAAGWGLLRLWRRRQLARLRRQTPLAGIVPAGRPAVVAFSTPRCVECRARQQPALERLARSLGEAATVRTISALDHPELVSQIGILTVPATVVVDARGVVRHLNLGYRGEQTLQEQVRPLLAA